MISHQSCSPVIGGEWANQNAAGRGGGGFFNEESRHRFHTKLEEGQVQEQLTLSHLQKGKCKNN